MQKISKLTSLALMSSLGAVSAAHAETDLACWNMFSARGSRPILKAKIAPGNVLTNVSWDFAQPTFEMYTILKDEELSSNRGHRHQEGKLIQPSASAAPTEITSARRGTYRGNNSYTLTYGHYVDQWPADHEYDNVRSDFDYSGELILPKDLSKDALAAFRIRNASERSNAVFIYGASPGSDQGGLNYLRMYCTSR